MKLVLASVLALALAAGNARANANSDLEASLRAEADAISSILKSIDATLSDAKRGTISESSAKAHRTAKAEYKQAEQLCKDRKYEACYGKLRSAKKTVMPAVTEVMSTGVSADVQTVVARDIEAAAKRIEGVAQLLAPNAPAEATEAYKQAKALYQEGKALYEKGQHRDAFAKLEPALDQLDIALRATWNARPAKSAKRR